MIIQRLTPLVNNLMHETLFTKSMLQKENESLSILFLGQAKIQLLSEFKKQHKLYPYTTPFFSTGFNFCLRI